MTLTCITLVTTVLTLQAQTSTTPNISYTPAQTKVAILPVIDGDGEKEEKTIKDEIGWVGEEMIKEFRERGFRIVKSPAIEDAIKRVGVDFSDEEQRKRATMLAIAKDVGADLVAFAFITDKAMTSAKKVATVKFWLLDVPHEGVWMSAKPQEGRSNFANRFNLAKWRRAFPFAVQEAFADFMKPYPTVPKSQQDNE